MKLLCQNIYAYGELEFARRLLAAGLRACCARPARLFSHVCACFLQMAAPARRRARSGRGAHGSRSLSRCGLALRALDPQSTRVLHLAHWFSLSYPNYCCTDSSLPLAFALDSGHIVATQLFGPAGVHPSRVDNWRKWRAWKPSMWSSFLPGAVPPRLQLRPLQPRDCLPALWLAS